MSTEKHTFFCEDPSVGHLSAEESNHAIRVLRLTTGQTIGIMDGKGSYYRARITVPNKKQVHFEIETTFVQNPPQNNLHIAIAPTKSMDRFFFFLEKAIEIGVQQITPLLTSHSERKKINDEKIQKQAIGAMKQSGQLYQPVIDPLTSINDFLEADHSEFQRFIAHCEEDKAKIAFKDTFQIDKNILILIGPEGDFTPEEINLAIANNFRPVSLGESRLRTETAGIVACHTVSILSS